MRLINADALKDSAYINKGNFNTVEGIRKWIDNAPTVEQKYYERVIAQINPVIDERPQGEWKEFKYGLYYCSRCFERVDKDIERIETLVSKGERSNYCSVCGADMRGDNDDG